MYQHFDFNLWQSTFKMLVFLNVEILYEILFMHCVTDVCRSFSELKLAIK